MDPFVFDHLVKRPREPIWWGTPIAITAADAHRIWSARLRHREARRGRV